MLAGPLVAHQQAEPAATLADTPGRSARTDTKLWHPFSDMAAIRGNEVVIERGEGSWLWDDKGTRYLDGSGALWYANIGHGRREIADAVHAQICKLESYSIFGDIAVPPALELAERLSALAPLDNGRVFFGMGGGDGTEVATKLIRYFWSANGQPERIHIITRTNAYHGSHAFATSIGGIAGALLAAAIFYYQMFVNHVPRWDLFAVVATAAVVKIAVLIWYRFTD